MAETVERVTDPADPERCQAQVRFGQCDKRSIPGTHLCPLHSRYSDVQKRELKNYRLDKFNQRVTELSTNDNLKHLNEEIGILRITLESVINSCGGDAQKLIYQSDHVGDLVAKIEKLVVSCQKLDIQNNQMLTIEQLNSLIDSLINIISRYLSGDQLKMCCAEIAASITHDQSLVEKLRQQLDNPELVSLSLKEQKRIVEEEEE